MINSQPKPWQKMGYYLHLSVCFVSRSWNNVTIEGASGGGAVLQNIQLKFSGELLHAGTNIENIIIKNITFYGNICDLQNLSGSAIQPGGTGTNYEGISFRRTTNAWVDHCTIYNTSDDLMPDQNDPHSIKVNNPGELI